MDKINEGMSNNTTCFSCVNFSISQGSEYDIREGNSYRFRGTLASSIVIAILSPVAVAGNTLILAVIWKKTFQRRFFHILLSGLAFADLCTGLIAQPVYAVTILLTSVNERAPIDRPRLYKTFGTIADASATYFICVTILILTVMSVERWLHMSRRSLVTSIRGCLTATVVFVIPAPLVVFRSLETLIKPRNDWAWVKHYEYDDNAVLFPNHGCRLL